MSANTYESQIEIEQYLDRTFDSFARKEFRFVPAKDLLSVQRMGSVYQKTKKHRRIPKIYSDRPQSPCLAYRDRRHRLYRHKSSSSDSTQSSGFIFIEGMNEISTHLSSNQYTLASEVSEQNDVPNVRQDDSTIVDYELPVSLSRQVSESSMNTDSLYLSSSADVSSSTVSLTTEDSEIPNVDVIRRSESSFVNFICYRTIGAPGVRKDYKLSSLCKNLLWLTQTILVLFEVI